MDNPIKIIREGILQHNLEKIRDGFQLLTGEKIKLEISLDATNSLIEKIEELLNDYKKNIILNPHIENRPPPSNPDFSKLPMPLATGVSTINKKGYYGNDTKPVTDDNIPVEEINKNKEKAAITKERKTKRSPSKKYNVKCSQCEQNFESDRQESKDFGQKCSKCLRDTIDGKILNE